MLNDILQSDIELARRLISEGNPDEAVVASLLKRRLNVEKAARLVADLRAGRTVVPDLHSIEAEPLPEAPRTQARHDSAQRKDRPRRKTPRLQVSQRRWAMVAVLVCLAGALGAVGVANRRYHQHTRMLLDRLEAISPQATDERDSLTGELSNRKLNEAERARLEGLSGPSPASK